MIKYFLLFIVQIALSTDSLYSQHVLVDGKLKVSDMDTLNSEELLVVKQVDGTLATRQASSLSEPTDTTRTFERDLELAKMICNCPYLPPFLIESALGNGYSEADLLNGGVDLVSVLSGGGDPLALFEAGASPVALVAAGVADSIFLGLEYEGGLIFYIDGSAGYGLVAANAILYGNDYGCYNTDVPTAEGTAIGTGYSNSQAIINICGTNTMAGDADNIVFNSFDDWYIASVNELVELFNVLNDIPNSVFQDDLGLRSSTDFPGSTNLDKCKGAFYPLNGTEAVILDFFKNTDGATLGSAFIRNVN